MRSRHPAARVRNGTTQQGRQIERKTAESRQAYGGSDPAGGARYILTGLRDDVGEPGRSPGCLPAGHRHRPPRHRTARRIQPRAARRGSSLSHDPATSRTPRSRRRSFYVLGSPTKRRIRAGLSMRRTAGTVNDGTTVRTIAHRCPPRPPTTHQAPPYGGGHSGTHLALAHPANHSSLVRSCGLAGSQSRRTRWGRSGGMLPTLPQGANDRLAG